MARPSPFLDPPAYAAWRHVDARDGFEVTFFGATGTLVGDTAAVERNAAWSVRYEIRVDAAWRTRSARVKGRSAAGPREVFLETDGSGRWEVDGKPAPQLDGCLDVDLESSALTNAFPVHRLGLGVGDDAQAPAAYVRAEDLGVARLEQRYVRLEDLEGRQRYRYRAPAFEFECELLYDEYGLVLEYPGLARRQA